MSHEINLIALNITFRRWEAFISSGKLGLAPVLHTLNAGDLVLRDQHQYLLQHCIGVSLCHYYALDPLSDVKTVDMSDE